MKAKAAANGEDFFDYDNFAIKAYALSLIHISRSV